MTRRYSHWTEEEENFLKSHYWDFPKTEIIKKINRSWDSILNKARKLGLKRGDKSLFNHENIDSIKLGGFDLGFVVGFIEGEGSILINSVTRKGYPNKTYHYPSIVFYNTNPELIKEIKKLLGIGIISKWEWESTRNYKPIYRCSIFRTRDIYQALKTIEPYLKGKRKQAQLVMEFIEIRNKNQRLWSRGEKGRFVTSKYTPRQIEIIKELKELNKRGKTYANQ